MTGKQARLTILVAVASNGVIGDRGTLPWRMPADLRHFKHTTMGHHVLMGRVTYESVGRPLPGRTVLVLSRSGRAALRPEDTGQVVASLDEACAVAAQAGDSELFIAGGRQVYQLALPRAQRMIQTQIDAEVPGDTFFPAWDRSEWELIESMALEDPRNQYPARICIFARKPGR